MSIDAIGVVNAAVATGTTLASLSALTGDSLTLRTGYGKPHLIGVIRGGENMQRIRITSNSLGSQAIEFDGGGAMGSEYAFKAVEPPMVFDEGEVLAVQVTQDSGGNEDEMAILLIWYPNSPSAAKRDSYERIITISGTYAANITANTWDEETLTWSESLLKNKTYHIIAAYAFSADLVGVRLKHTDFKFYPAFPGKEDVGGQWFEFPTDDIPEFLGSNDPPICQAMGGAANTPKIYLQLGEF